MLLLFVCLVCGIDFSNLLVFKCVGACMYVCMCVCSRDGEEMQKMRGHGWMSSREGHMGTVCVKCQILFCFVLYQFLSNARVKPPSISENVLCWYVFVCLNFASVLVRAYGFLLLPSPSCFVSVFCCCFALLSFSNIRY